MLHRPFPIRSKFGQSYLLCRTLLDKQFQKRAAVRRVDAVFLRDLQASPEFWQQILLQYGTGLSAHMLSDMDIMEHVSDLFQYRTLHLYPLPAQALESKNTHRVFQHTGNYQTYQFSYLPLPNKARLHKPTAFKGICEAEEFIAALGLSSGNVASLCADFGLSDNGFAGSGFSGNNLISQVSQKNTLTKALLNGDIFASLKPIISLPRPENNADAGLDEGIANKKETPDSTTNAVVTPVEDRLCQRNALTISCSHGKSVTLDASIKYTPTLEIVASSLNGKSPDKIQLSSDITDICEQHKHGHVTVSCDEIKASIIERGKITTFNAFAPNLNIRYNPIKYAWLPAIKPKIYTIYLGETCDDSLLAGAGKNITLHAYPKIAWDWGVNIGYGKDEYTLNENNKNKGQYQQKLTSKRFSISGHVKLTQDDQPPVELNNEFKQAIAGTVNQIESITALVDSVIGEFDQGKNPKVTVTWPNLNLNLKTEITEGSGKQANYRTIGFDFGISAAPFFGLDVEVDILPIIAKPLDGGAISKWLIEEAQATIKKGMGNKDGLAYLQGEVSIIMKGTGALGFETHFKGDFSNSLSAKNGTIKKITGKPVTGKIEFSAEGKIDVKGHVLQVKVELVAGVGIKSGINLGIVVDCDEKGYYWQPEVAFTGLKVFVTKYVKVNVSMEGKTGWGKKSKPKITTQRKKEYVWIKESTLQTQPHYFIEYKL